MEEKQKETNEIADVMNKFQVLLQEQIKEQAILHDRNLKETLFNENLFLMNDILNKKNMFGFVSVKNIIKIFEERSKHF